MDRLNEFISVTVPGYRPEENDEVFLVHYTRITIPQGPGFGYVRVSGLGIIRESSDEIKKLLQSMPNL